MMGLKKNLLFVIPSLAGGGAEKVLVHLLNHLDEARYDVTVVLFEDVMTYEAAINFPIRWVKLDKKSKWDVVKILFRLRRTFAQVCPDTIIASLYYANILTAVAALGLNARPRVVLCEHNDPRVYSALYRLLIRLTYGHADAVVSVSGAIGEALSSRFNVDPAKIRVIHNPVPVDEIGASANSQDLEHPFLAESSGPIIIGMGRLTPVKRFDRLLEAFAALHLNRADARLVILGDGPLKKELEQHAVDLSVRDFVCFAGFQSNPYAWMAKADLFVLSSDVEGFPMAILEAMALGTCVLATDTPSGPRESIEDRVNGRLVPRDLEALTSAMRELIQNEALRTQLAGKALETVRQYRIETVLRYYYEVF